MADLGRYVAGDDAARDARVLASIDDVIQVVSLQGVLIATTVRGAEMLLADRTEATAGKAWIDMWDGGARPIARRALSDAVGGRRSLFTAEVEVKSGRAWFDVVLTPMFAASGEICDILVVSRDISVRHAAEVQLRQSEEHYRQLAIALQAASLPTVLPRINDLEIDAYYCPSSETATICGDWYDAVPVGEKKLLFTIGDIAGHGLKAAVTMTRVKQAMEAVALIQPDPTLMLSVANETILRIERDLIATALVGVFDAEHRILDLATAGHPPPIVCDATGNVSEYRLTACLPLGIKTDLMAVSQQMPFTSGSALVMFTDGLVESGRDVSSAYRRLKEVVSHKDILWSSRAAAAIVEAVLDDSPARDDIAVLVLRQAGS